MTRDEGVAMIKQVLGFRTGLDSTIVTNMKYAQTVLEAGPTRPFWLTSEDSFTLTTADEERVAIPSDFLEESDQAVLKYVPDDGSEEVDLKKDLYDVLRVNYRFAASGPPESYALLGLYFRLFPLPDAAYTIRMIFSKTDQLLTSNIENGWLRWNPMALLGLAGGIVAISLRDTVAKMEFDRWAAQGRVLLATQTNSREMQNMDMQVGGPH